MGPEEEEYLLSFDRGARGVARAALSAMGYAAFVLGQQQSFQSGVDCLQAQHPRRTTYDVAPRRRYEVRWWLR